MSTLSDSLKKRSGKAKPVDLDQLERTAQPRSESIRTTFYLAADLHKRLKTQAETERRAMSTIVTMALEQYLESNR